jgi:hypothetical protein
MVQSIVYGDEFFKKNNAGDSGINMINIFDLSAFLTQTCKSFKQQEKRYAQDYTR